MARADYGPEEAAFQAYLKDGERRAFELGNRGPIRFTADGALHPDILDAYRRCGFYVFEGVLGEEELADVEADLFDIIDRLPVEQGSPVDAKGRPALAHGCEAPTLFWSKPLADPFGGTDLANGRHPVKMMEPVPRPGRPEGGGLPRPRVPPVLGGMRPALRPPRAPRGRGGGERR